MWNNHGLSTEKGQTPLQLWHRGIVSHIGINNTAIYGVLESDEHFNINENRPPPELQSRNNIVVPENIYRPNDTIPWKIFWKHLTHYKTMEIMELIYLWHLYNYWKDNRLEQLKCFIVIVLN